MKIATEMKAGPKWSAWATRARAITAPDRTVRNMVTRPSDSWYVRARVARRLQCSVARIWMASESCFAGGSSVDICAYVLSQMVALAHVAAAAPQQVVALAGSRCQSRGR